MYGFIRALSFSTAALWAGSACTSDKAPTTEPATPSDAAETQTAEPAPTPTNKTATGPAAEAKQVFASRCATCHGADGTGSGPLAKTLNPKPRNYTDAAWQKTISDSDLTKIIVGGGPALGKSIMMPPNPDLKEKPDVVKELVKIVRGFAKKE